MRSPINRPTMLTPLSALREPAGLVCLVLMAALLTVIARIAAVW